MTNAIQSVTLMQDGAIDELMSVIFLTTMPNVSLFNIDILNADCLAYPTMETTVKILNMLGVTNTMVATSDARGWNAFPWTYRQYAMMVNLLPMINQYGNAAAASRPESTKSFSEHLVAAKAGDNPPPSTILCLCPLTDIAAFINAVPDYKDYIDSIVWMGGVWGEAGQAPPIGNIDTGLAPGANPNAEWNAYWDYDAVQTVLGSGIEFNIFPLNVTNNVLLTSQIIEDYFLSGSNSYPMLDLAAQMYSMVAFQTGFSFWDTATTAFIGNPGLFTMTPMNITIDTGPDPTTQGTITAVQTGGYPVNMATTIDVQGFYDYFVGQLKTITIACWPPGSGSAA